MFAHVQHLQYPCRIKYWFHTTKIEHVLLLPYDVYVRKAYEMCVLSCENFRKTSYITIVITLYTHKQTLTIQPCYGR